MERSNLFVLSIVAVVAVVGLVTVFLQGGQLGAPVGEAAAPEDVSAEGGSLATGQAYYGVQPVYQTCYDNDRDGVTGCAGDCNDFDSAVAPGRSEVCDLKDNDCDGSIDEGFATRTYYRDGDGDGYGIASNTKLACTQPPGYRLTLAGNDCNDVSNTVHPGAAEVCNRADDDCDGKADEGVCSTCVDTDGYNLYVGGEATTVYGPSGAIASDVKSDLCQTPVAKGSDGVVYSNTLREVYCSTWNSVDGSVATFRDVSCPKGCVEWKLESSTSGADIGSEPEIYKAQPRGRCRP